MHRFFRMKPKASNMKSWAFETPIFQFTTHLFYVKMFKVSTSCPIYYIAC